MKNIILHEITMKNDNYCRINISGVSNSLKDNFAKLMSFLNYEEMAESGYAGNFELSCQYNEKTDTISEAEIIYFMDEYESVCSLSNDEIQSLDILNHIKKSWNALPDNNELCLGDGEWYELAYNKK